MTLRLPITDLDRKLFLQIPSPGSNFHASNQFPAPPIELCAPFHGECVPTQTKQQEIGKLLAQLHQTGLADRDGREEVKGLEKQLQAAQQAAAAGDSPFWGPSAFQPAPQVRPRDAIVCTALEQMAWQQSTTTRSGAESSHYSFALGVGVGRSWLGASVTGKYDRAVSTSENTSRDSVSVRYASSLIKLKSNSRPLHPAALQLLQHCGPAAFETVYGTHFVAGFVLGGESGYCISLETDSMQQHDAFSVLAEVHVLFWSVGVEVPLLDETTSAIHAKPIVITSYDTLDAVFEQRGPGVDARPLTAQAFVEAAGQVRRRISSLAARVAAAVAQSPRAAAAAAAADDDDDYYDDGLVPPALVLEILVSPWTVLQEWRQGCSSWQGH